MKLSKYDTLIDELVACFNHYPELDPEDRKAFYGLIGYFYKKIESVALYDSTLLTYSETYCCELRRGDLEETRVGNYEGSDWAEHIDTGIPKAESRPIEDMLYKIKEEQKYSNETD